MYRITKILNHNGILAVDLDDQKEYVLLGKGIGFGRKIMERFTASKECAVYSLQEKSDRVNNKELLNTIDPEYFEYANQILSVAEQRFHTINRSILFPMADHLAFAIQRIQKGEHLYNPLTNDIKALFYSEFKVAAVLRDILKREKQMEIDDDEISYVALHIHSALNSVDTSISIQMAEAVQICIATIEEKKQGKIDTMSLSYNRLMSHVKYMVVRLYNKEELKINMNDYMEFKYPDSFHLAKEICEKIEKVVKEPIKDVEIGYLAMHIERILLNDE